VELRLPAWAEALGRGAIPPLHGPRARMRFAIELARRNVAAGTGGPFGAAVFERDAGRLVAFGVNVVVASGCSHAHSEMLALALAERAVGGHDLGSPGLPAHELVSSAEPCAMCLGAVVWSGVRRLVCGARDEDARAVGFDEGPKATDWERELAARGIAVVRDVERESARAVLLDYLRSGGPIYGPRRDR
jgi:tRNA(Arg) A34 adenosine deaminase TadA